jgi:D-3-phosphoglycerate dehydrogenase / 2-oxoglutarate reductase
VPRVLVTEQIADSGLDRLRQAGHEVDVALGLEPDELAQRVAGAEALIIRSATKVTEAVLDAGRDLLVVGRAGIGLDNIDLAAATQRGVMVVNAPESNVISAAEHTMALMLAASRNVPQAHAALVAGRWERSRWNGVELHGKRLGVAGLGRVGRLVAARCAAFGMEVVAYDPYVSEERAAQLDVLLLDFDELMATADVVTVHLPKTPDTNGLVDAAALRRAKRSMVLVNTARGGIVDETALYEALRDGEIAGAGLDVFEAEPTTESPLFSLENVVVTPHLGASTSEAQDKAGVTIAEMVELALAGEFVPYAVNVDAREVSEAVKPYLPLAEKLGRFLAGLTSGLPGRLEVTVVGQLAEHDTSLLKLAVMKGLLGRVSTDPVSYVNAPRLAESHGMEVHEARSSTSHEYVNLLTVAGDDHEVGGTLAGLRGEERIVSVDHHTVELPPARDMLLVRNDDTPGMIGQVGTLLGNAGINVSDMSLGRSPKGDLALMLLATDVSVPPAVLEALAASPGIRSVTTLTT